MALIDADYFNQQMLTLGLKSSFTPVAAVLATLIDEASEWIEAECNRKFGTNTITEDIRGRGTRRIILGHYPVSTITSINWVDDSVVSGSVPTTDVRILEGGMLEYKNPLVGPFYKQRYYTVVYTTPTVVPGPIKRATALKVADLLSPQYSGPRDKSVELMSNIQEQIITLIEPYRRERLG